MSATEQIARLLGRQIRAQGDNLISRIFFYERDLTNLVRFGLSAPRSAQLIWIDPADVKLTARSLGAALRIESGLVADGDWDRRSKSVTTLEKVRGVHQRIVEGRSWPETECWSRMEFLLKTRPKGADGCRNMKDVAKRYKALDEFISQIRIKGADAYKARCELDPANFREATGLFMNIDRHGNLLFNGRGCHRLSIAQALQIPVIPAQLGKVHRDAVKSGAWRKYLKEPPRAIERNSKR